MSRLATISTGAFVVLLLLFVATREDRVSVGVRSLDLPDIERDDITGVELGGSRSVRLLRDGDTWTLRDPEDPERALPADPGVVDRALAAIEELEAERFVTARAENHAELQIDDETGTLVTISRSGGDNVSLVLGRRAKSGGVLLRRRDSDEVFTGPVALAALQTPFEGWRRRKLMDFGPDDVATLAVARPGESTVVLEGVPSEGDHRTWRLGDGVERPEGFLLDETAVASRVRALAGLRAIEFVDHDPGSGATGLDETATRVTATFDEAEPVTLAIGAEGEPGRVHLRIEGDPQIYLVAKGVAAQLRPSVVDLRDLRLFRFDPNAVREMRVEGGDQVVVVSRSDASDAWTLEEPSEPGADFELGPQAVTMQMRSLTGTRATAVHGPEADAPVDFSQGLAFSFQLADGKSLRVDLAEADDGEVYARVGDGFAYRVPSVVRSRWSNPLPLFQRPPDLPPRGAPAGMENLPPELRRQLEEAMRRQGAGGP